jgi:hypothetical protein
VALDRCCSNDPVERVIATLHPNHVSGSRTLVRAVLADALVDEMHLFVYRSPAGL